MGARHFTILHILLTTSSESQYYGRTTIEKATNPGILKLSEFYDKRAKLTIFLLSKIRLQIFDNPGNHGVYTKLFRYYQGNIKF